MTTALALLGLALAVLLVLGAIRLVEAVAGYLDAAAQHRRALAADVEQQTKRRTDPL